MPTTTTTTNPSMLTKASHLAEDAAASVQDITQRGLDRAKEVSATLRDRAYSASSNTVGYVREQPLKSVLIAVAAGAAIAVLARLLSGSRHH